MAEPTSSKKTVSRRVLFSAGAGAGLCRLATARAEPEDAIDARDVANGLNCCLGAVDLILLLEIKPSLREVAETVREVLRFLPALTARTLALVGSIILMLVIGYGNALRGDDAAGIHAATRIAA